MTFCIQIGHIYREHIYEKSVNASAPSFRIKARNDGNRYFIWLGMINRLMAVYHLDAFYLKQTEFAMPLIFMFPISFQKIIILKNGDNTYAIRMLSCF